MHAWLQVRVPSDLLDYLDTVQNEGMKPDPKKIDTLLKRLPAAPWIISGVSPHHSFLALATLACNRINEEIDECPLLYKLPKPNRKSEKTAYQLDIYEDALLSHSDFLQEESALTLSRYLAEQFESNSVPKPTPHRAGKGKAGGGTEAGGEDEGKGERRKESPERIWGA